LTPLVNVDGFIARLRSTRRSLGGAKSLRWWSMTASRLRMQSS